MDVGEATLRVRHRGSGPPLLLLHGHPQTHMMWHAVALRLAERFTVVAPDLRGYGESSKPATTPEHEPYSKRAMARDQVALMRSSASSASRSAATTAAPAARTGSHSTIPSASTAGGARHRPDRRRLPPRGHALRPRLLALVLPRPARRPRRADDRRRPGRLLLQPRTGASCSHPEALDDYLRCARDPETIHAMCEDYRAGATFDFALDEADRGTKRIACPVLVLWGGRGKLPELRRRAGHLAGAGRTMSGPRARLWPLPARGSAGGDLRSCAAFFEAR